MGTKEKKALAAALLGNSVFGFSFMASKIALGAAQPMVLLGFRFLLAFLVMNLMLLAGKEQVHLKGKPVGLLLLLGLFQPILYFIFESYGIKWTTSGFSGAMIAMVPVVSMAFAASFLRERPKGRQVLFALLSVAGVILISLSGESEGVIEGKGILMLVLTVLSASGYNIVGRKISGDFTAFERTYVMFAMGSLFFGGLMLFTYRESLAAEVLRPLTAPGFLGAVFYLAMVSSVLAFMALNYAMTYLPVAKSTAFTNITTVISIFAGVIFLGEPFGLVSLIGAVMIIVGVYGVNKEQSA